MQIHTLDNGKTVIVSLSVRNLLTLLIELVSQDRSARKINPSMSRTCEDGIRLYLSVEADSIHYRSRSAGPAGSEYYRADLLKRVRASASRIVLKWLKEEGK